MHHFHWIEYLPLARRRSQETLLDKLPEYRKVINFAYVPVDFRSMCNLGSAAVLAVIILYVGIVRR